MKTSLEELEEQCEEITEQIKKIGSDKNSHYVIDGVIAPQKYVEAKYRILWILKAADSKNMDWSYLKNFKDKEWLENYAKKKHTLRKLIYTTYGILKGCEWSEIPDAKEDEALKVLQEIAIINIKKVPWGTSSKYKEIKNASNENKELLKKQIDTYDADVVIFGNTLNFFDKSSFEGLEKTEMKKTEINTHVYDTGDKLYIHAWHPSNTKYTENVYVMDIVNIVKNWKK